jgi:hypothetical protein
VLFSPQHARPQGNLYCCSHGACVGYGADVCSRDGRRRSSRWRVSRRTHFQVVSTCGLLLVPGKSLALSDPANSRAAFFASVLLAPLLLHLLSSFFLLLCYCCFLGQSRQNCILHARIQVAIAVGDLESREVSPRCRVWSEPSMVEAASFEFSQTEDFLKVLQ